MAVLLVATGLVIIAACGGDVDAGGPVWTTTVAEGTATTTAPTTPAPAGSSTDGGACADVIGAELAASGDGTYRVSATVSSADTGLDKYADEWRVVAPNGSVLGVRVLAHPHVDEQPFTRSLSGVEIPAGVDRVTIEARDSVVGYCGVTVSVAVP